MDIYDIDNLIDLFNSFDSKKDEFGEQDGTDAGSSAPSGYPTVTKWETGIARGPANQIGNTKWRDSHKIVRGKANTLL